MLQKVRMFIAVEISSEVHQRAARLITKLDAAGANVRWSKPEQMHLTLKFLGDVDLRDVPEVCGVMSRVASTVPPFSLRFVGAGAFPNAAHPRTIWIGADEGSDEVALLHERLDEELAHIGYRREHRRFRPHLTIGRVRGEGGALGELEQALGEHRDAVVGVTDVDELVAFSSELARSGPIYEPLGTAQLEGE